MRLPTFIVRVLCALAGAVIRRRPNPDFIVGGRDNAYMHRWWVIPRNRLFNVYLHRFYRSDDDRALHDHPWLNVSLLLVGEYTIAAGGIHERRVRRAGDVVARAPRAAHRIELHAGACATLFLTGPNVRTWGFHCPEHGWIPWKRFTSASDSGQTGPGCEG